MSSKAPEEKFAERVIKGRPKKDMERSLDQIKQEARRHLEALAGEKAMTVEQAVSEAETASVRTDWHKSVAQLDRIISFKCSKFEGEILEAEG